MVLNNRSLIAFIRLPMLAISRRWGTKDDAVVKPPFISGCSGAKSNNPILGADVEMGCGEHLETAFVPVTHGSETVQESEPESKSAEVGNVMITGGELHPHAGAVDKV